MCSRNVQDSWLPFQPFLRRGKAFQSYPIALSDLYVRAWNPWYFCALFELLYIYFRFVAENEGPFPLIHSGIPTHGWKEVSDVSRTFVWEDAFRVLTRTTGFMRHLPIMLTRTHSSTRRWPAPGPQGWLEVMAVSLPHGVPLSGMLPPAGCSAAISKHPRVW